MSEQHDEILILAEKLVGSPPFVALAVFWVCTHRTTPAIILEAVGMAAMDFKTNNKTKQKAWRAERGGGRRAQKKFRAWEERCSKSRWVYLYRITMFTLGVGGPVGWSWGVVDVVDPGSNEPETTGNVCI